MHPKLNLVNTNLELESSVQRREPSRQTVPRPEHSSLPALLTSRRITLVPLNLGGERVMPREELLAL